MLFVSDVNVTVSKFLLECSWFYLQDKAKMMDLFIKVTKLYDDFGDYNVHK